MDSTTETSLFPQIWDSAMTGGGVLLLIVGVVIAVAFVVVGGFMVADRMQGERRTGRDRAQWHANRKRKQQDLLHRIRAYARERHEAVANGDESPESALQSLRHYGHGVTDTVACSMRSDQQIDAVNRLMDKEMAVLEQSARRILAQRSA